LAIKIKNKFIIVTVLFIITLFFYIFFLFIINGPPAHFLSIHNHDVKSHEVEIQVTDQHNKLIINETYTLEPKSDLVRSRPLSLKFSREKKEYMFKVIIDKQIENTVKIEIPHQFSTVVIRLYYEDPQSGEIIPLRVNTEVRV